LVDNAGAQSGEDLVLTPRPHPDEIPNPGHFMPKPYHAATLVRHIHDLMRTLRQ
jgi:hypothetical protein